MKRYCLALDLKNDADLIAAYKRHHEKIWPEISASIKNSGIEQMEIYCTGNRLCMIMETSDDFSFERKSKMDAGNIKVQEWETLMGKYQKAIPWVKQNEKWVLMDKIFDLTGQR
jgi:L-rhamnose mutarotase